VQLAQGNPELTTLVAALTKFPDLVTTLSGTGTFTVFAPSNAAFTSLLGAIGQTSLDDIPEPVLRDVLEYHVITSGAVFSNQLTDGNVATLGGESIAVTISPSIRLNNSVNVVNADVRATNGVVHVVDAVLVPPSIVPVVGTIVAPAFFNKNFTTLVAAVNQAGLLPTLLSTTNQLTLFAPTNAAFTAAGITALPPNTTEGHALLTSILAYQYCQRPILCSYIWRKQNLFKQRHCGSVHQRNYSGNCNGYSRFKRNCSRDQQNIDSSNQDDR
jgi:transforming growth factor-beta-induced protein